MRRGYVSLVGAGPGDPELITVAGVARLAEADVIVFDRLANPALLRHAKSGAEMIDAGKQAGRHTLTQDEINSLLVERGRAGKRVVRLKGGDPFVLGRGGEEAEALREAGVAFEVIPGVTSAIAAPAYAGIPVTHRGLSSSFAVVTAHEDAGKGEPMVDWTHLARGVDTVIFLMGVARLEATATALIAHGRPPDTPAAVVEWGTLPRQRTVSGTLASIAAEASRAAIGAPAVTVVGEVARLRDGLRWFDTRPLFGKRVLVTRTREQAGELSRALLRQGADAVELPTIEIVETADLGEVERAIEALCTSAYQWCVFTSQNAVGLFMSHLRQSGHDARALGRTRIGAVGAGTEAALARHGLRCDAVPDRYIAEGLLDELAPRVMRGQRVLLPRAEGARDTLVEGLAARGAVVDELRLYRAAIPADRDAAGLTRLRADEFEFVTFASSSAVRNLVQMLDGEVAPLRRATIAVIGPVTAQAVRDAGLKVSVQAETYTIEGLVSALVAHVRSGSAEG